MARTVKALFISEETLDVGEEKKRNRGKLTVQKVSAFNYNMYLLTLPQQTLFKY